MAAASVLLPEYRRAVSAIVLTRFDGRRHVVASGRFGSSGGAGREHD